MAEPVYVQAGANVEATDTFATWVNTTNSLVYDMGTKVLTASQFDQPNTSVGGYVSGNSHIEGIFSANTIAVASQLRGGTVSTPAVLTVTSNTIFSQSPLVQIGANTENFNINANTTTITSNVVINTAKSVNVTAANTTINSGNLYVKTDSSFTGSRIDVDGSILDVTSNTVFTSATLNANVDVITLGFNGSDALNVNAVSDFNANVNIDGVLTSTANALFTGAQAQFDNNVIVGSSTADSLTVNAFLASDLLPSATTIDLGSSANKYGNVHSTYVYAGADVEASGEFRLKGSTAKTLRVSDTAYQDFKLVFDNGTTANTAVVANTSGLFGGVNQLYSLGSSSVNWKNLYVQNSFVTADQVVTGDVAVNGGDITTSATAFNLLNTTALTLNIGGAATAINLGATTGTLTVNNPTIVGTQTTQNVFNTVATTVNAFGAATTLNIGSNGGSGQTNIKTANTVFSGGVIDGSSATTNVFNTPTTINAFKAATALSIGAASGTTTVNNDAVVTGDVAVNGGDITSSATTFNLLNSTVTTLNVGNAATTLNVGNAAAAQTVTIGGSSTAASTYNVGTGATASTFTKTVNVGTGGVAGSTSNINIGSASGGTVTVNTPTVVGAATTVNLWNTASTTVNAFGAASALNIGANAGTLTVGSSTLVGTQTTQNVFNTVATTVNAFSAATSVNVGEANANVSFGKSSGNTSITILGNGIGGTATLTSNVTTGKVAIAPSVTTGTIEAGSANLGTAKVLFTTDSDASTTGALVVAGGVGIGKVLRVANNAYIAGDLTVNGQVSFTGNVNVNLASANTADLNVTNIAEFSGTIGSSMIPRYTSTYNLGSTGRRWLKVFTDDLTVTNDVTANNVYATNALTSAALTVKNGNKDAIIISGVAGSTDKTYTIQTPAAGLSANASLTLANGSTILQAGTVAITGAGLNQFASTTSSQLAGVISDETGSGSLVFATSPTLVTPVLGVATATSINKVAITAPATGSTLTIADGKTATINNTLTLSGTDGSTIALGAGGTVVYASNKLSALSSTTSAELAGVISDETGSGVLVFGTSPTFTTSLDSSATFSGFASASALTLGYTGTAASTLNLSTGVTAISAIKTINIGTGGATGSTTNINFGSTSGTGTATFNNDLVVTGNLTVNGTTSTINSTTISVDDKNIELGAVTTPTNATADGGGITLRGATDKTLNWINTTGSWTSSENLDIASSKTYKINTVDVLSATTLGSSVVNSSLTSVGTIATGTWNATTIAVNKGGTGQTTYTNGQLLIGNTTGNTLTKATLTQGQNITVTNGAGSITIAAANTDLTWTAGTTAGPVLNSSTGAGQVIPSASATASGIVTTTAQTIAGDKTFSGNTSFGPMFINTTDNVASIGSTVVATLRRSTDGTAITPGLQISGNTTDKTSASLINWAANNTMPMLLLGKSRGGAPIAETRGIVNSTDVLGVLAFEGDDGANFVPAATIRTRVDGTPGLENMPGQLIFSTTAAGANTVSDRMVIAANGNIGIATTAPTSTIHVAGTSNITGIATFGANVAITGTITSGTWNGTVVAGQYGGTGVNNTGKTITLGGNISTANSVTTSGNFALTLTSTAATNVTLPTTGTLATLAGAETFTNKTLTSPTITSGSINNTPIGATTANTGNFSTLSIGGTAITSTAAQLNFANTVTSNIQTQLDTKAPLASPALTGTPTAPTATAGTNTTQVATTAFVSALGSTKANLVGDTFTGEIVVDTGAAGSGLGLKVMTGATAVGNPNMYVKKTANTVFDIGGWNGTALEGTIDLNFTAINSPAAIRTTGSLGIRSASPTMYFRDTDGNSAMLHTNDNKFYVLRGGNDTETWTQVNGQWPLYIDLTTNNATFGGNVYAAGNVTAYSDARLKSDVRTIDKALDKVSALRGVYYTKDGKAGLGVIAQETELVLPEVVVENDNDGYKSVAYGNIVGVLIEAIKELKAEIEELKKGK